MKLCDLHGKRRITHNILAGEELAEDEEEGIILEAGGKRSLRRIVCIHYIRCNRDVHYSSTCNLPWDRIE